jgi:hypothetical protein
MDSKEEYQLFLDHVEKLIDRRQTVTTTYLTVNAAVIAAIAFVLKDAPMLEWGRQVSGLVLLVVGIISCALWRRLIAQYSILLGWWYAQLRDLEGNIAASSKLLTKEYDDLYAHTADKGKVSLTRYEIRLAYVFITVYAVLGVLLTHSLLRSVL